MKQDLRQGIDGVDRLLSAQIGIFQIRLNFLSSSSREKVSAVGRPCGQ